MVVCVKRPFGSAEHVLQYLAHYTHSITISNERLIAAENGQVTFRWLDSPPPANRNTQKIMNLESVKFIRRFVAGSRTPTVRPLSRTATRWWLHDRTLSRSW